MDRDTFYGDFVTKLVSRLSGFHGENLVNQINKQSPY